MRPFTNRTAPTPSEHASVIIVAFGYLATSNLNFLTGDSTATAKKLTNQALACSSCFTTKRRASSQLSRLVSSWPEAMAFRRSCKTLQNAATVQGDSQLSFPAACRNSLRGAMPLLAQEAGSSRRSFTNWSGRPKMMESSAMV